MFTLQRGVRYEMPPTSGPVPLDHISYGEVSRATISFLSTKDALAKLLPPGLEPADEPTVSVSHHKILDVSFLAGRGYNILSVDLAAVFQGETRMAGSYPPVVWEDDVYSIIVGREPFGVAKIFADIPDVTRNASNWQMECSEFGAPLVTGYLKDMQPLNEERVRELNSIVSQPGHTFRWKHIPNAFGGASASYLMKGNQMIGTVDSAWSGEGTHQFHTPPREAAPVSYRFMHALQELTVVERRPALAIHGTVNILQRTGQPLDLSNDELKQGSVSQGSATQKVTDQ